MYLPSVIEGMGFKIMRFEPLLLLEINFRMANSKLI